MAVDAGSGAEGAGYYAHCGICGSAKLTAESRAKARMSNRFNRDRRFVNETTRHVLNVYKDEFPAAPA
jgi:hypothetical protein